MTVNLLAFQKEPAEDWSRWDLIGDRATGKTFAMHVMALRRAAAGEHVAIVTTRANAGRLFADIVSLLPQALADDTAWAADTGARRLTVNNGRVDVFPVDSPDSVRGSQYDTAVFEDINNEDLPELQQFKRNLTTTGVERFAYTSFAPGLVNGVRAEYTPATPAPTDAGA